MHVFTAHPPFIHLAAKLWAECLSTWAHWAHTYLHSLQIRQTYIDFSSNQWNIFYASVFRRDSHSNCGGSGGGNNNTTSVLLTHIYFLWGSIRNVKTLPFVLCSEMSGSNSYRWLNFIVFVTLITLICAHQIQWLLFLFRSFSLPTN